MGGGFWESFRAVGNDGTFELKPYWQKIHPKLSDDAKGQLIESVTLCLVGSGKPRTCKAESELQTNGTLGFNLGKELNRRLKEDYKVNAFFLSIKFNSGAVKWLDGFNQYNYDSPWNIQVGIYSADLDLFENPENSLQPGYEKDLIALKIVDKKKQILERRRASMGSWEIMRHKKFGEIPSFKWRNRKSKREYVCNLVLKH
jgi:hypothetical protein